MGLDKQRIERLLALIRERSAVVINYAALPEDELRSDPGRLLAIEHALQTMIQSVLDIGSHILVSMGYNRLDTYADVFNRMAEASILDPEFARSIRGMAGLRNLLVHEYAEIDEARILEYARQRLSDFEEFESQVRRFLKARHQTPD